MGMKHAAKRIARETGMPNCGHEGAFLYVTPAPHGFAGNDRLIQTHHRDHVYHLALRSRPMKPRRTHAMRPGMSTLPQIAARLAKRWHDWERA